MATYTDLEREVGKYTTKYKDESKSKQSLMDGCHVLNVYLLPTLVVLLYKSKISFFGALNFPVSFLTKLRKQRHKNTVYLHISERMLCRKCSSV